MFVDLKEKIAQELKKVNEDKVKLKSLKPTKRNRNHRKKKKNH